MPTLNDLWYQWLAKATGQSVPATPANQSGATADTSQVVNQNDSRTGVGSVTAPAATTDIATRAVLAAGYYKVTCFYGYGATAESTTPDNFQLVVNTSVKWSLLSVVAAANTLWTQVFYLKATGADTFKIQSVGAGSAGSIYKAQITLDRLS